MVVRSVAVVRVAVAACAFSLCSLRRRVFCAVVSGRSDEWNSCAYASEPLPCHSPAPAQHGKPKRIPPKALIRQTTRTSPVSLAGARTARKA
eukprot:634744-Prorocentrum_minimum.AAC.2